MILVVGITIDDAQNMMYAILVAVFLLLCLSVIASIIQNIRRK